MTQAEVKHPDQALKARAKETAHDLMSFIDQSPSAFHAVATMEKRLQAEGFSRVLEQDAFDLQPQGRYYLTRNGSALVAFVLGTRAPSVSGFRLAGAHTDSPGLRLKPQPETMAAGLVKLGVEVYGGPILATWTDRDLGLCGRVVLSGDGQRLEQRLLRLDQPVISLPNQAIHFNRLVNDDGLKLNPQTELTPILGQAGILPAAEVVKKLLSDALGVPGENILSFDLMLFDLQKSCFAGLEGELIHAPRLDDLNMCHAAMSALLTSAREPLAATRVVVCYDNEEVGSRSGQGAFSNLVPNLLERIALAQGDARASFLPGLARSLMVSADAAHALHPGYENKSEPQHAPLLNGGPVIKAHAGRSYATDAISEAAFLLACRKAQVPCQHFVNRSDGKGGSTIGSMVAAQLGVPVVDVGNPQLAMHSVREMMGTYDQLYMIEALKAFMALDISGLQPGPGCSSDATNCCN